MYHNSYQGSSMKNDEDHIPLRSDGREVGLAAIQYSKTRPVLHRPPQPSCISLPCSGLKKRYGLAIESNSKVVFE